MPMGAEPGYRLQGFLDFCGSARQKKYGKYDEQKNVAFNIPFVVTSISKAATIITNDNLIFCVPF